MLRICIAFTLCLSVAHAATLPYERPLDADCVSINGSNSQVAYITPQSYYLTGASSASEPGYTTVSVSQDFGVQYYPLNKVVSNNVTGEKYVLHQCGTNPPALNLLGGKVFQIPLSRVAVPETVPYAFLEILGVQSRVQYVSSYTVSPCAQAAITCGHLAADPTNTTALDAQLPEVDAIIATSASNSSKIITFSSATDPGALKRAEWVKFLAPFFNKESVANLYYAGVEAAYNVTKTKAAAQKTKPVVAWVQYNSYEPAAYQIDFAQYKVELTQDAGAVMLNNATVAATAGVTVSSYSPSTFLYAWGTNTTFANQESARLAFLASLAKVDVIVDENYALDPKSYNLTAFTAAYNLTRAEEAKISALAGAIPLVFREDGLLSAALGLDWFEGAIAKPDLVLADFYTAFHPTVPVNKKPFTWIRHISQSPVVVTAVNCSTITACDQQAATICPYVKQCPDNSTVSVTDQSKCTYNACPAATSGASSTTISIAFTAVVISVTLVSTLLL